MAVRPFFSIAARIPLDFIPIRTLSSFIFSRVLASMFLTLKILAITLVFFSGSSDRHFNRLLAQYLTCFRVICFKFGCLRSYFFPFLVALRARSLLFATIALP